MKNLVIVESPAKAGTITKILGKDYTVKSSFGHVRDLAKDGENNTGIEVKNKYKPHYEIPSDKKKVVAELQKSKKSHKKVILATDEDREGEAISWHLAQVLKLKKNDYERITFTEITPDAIKKAIKNPRAIDEDLVNAQQARRILDRLVGFELTKLLWKKVRGKLSAGRVQSVAVRLVVEREREIKDFKPESYFKITGTFIHASKETFEAELSERIKALKSVTKFLESCKKAVFTVSSVDVKPAKKNPAPPFTTSTLQQMASQKLGFSVSRTMNAAQRLYEAGHITYMRTDSTTLSGTAIGALSAYIKKEYGEKYLTVRQFKTKSKSSQEAHEAIRPTYIQKAAVSKNPDQQKLYQLIRTRTLASQMASAEVEKTEIRIDISTVTGKHFIAKGEIITFDGFLKAYKGTKYVAQDSTLLPKVSVGDILKRKIIQALERQTKPPARYSEATLVKKLEELGIGRPSTYAPTIAKITSPTRGYITKETRDGDPTDYVLLELKDTKITESKHTEVSGAQKNKLFAHDIGLMVTDFLQDNFRDIMDYSFTAEVEDKLDNIAEGKEDWIKVLDTYYKPFTKTVDTALDEAERVTGERVLGKDPATGRTLLVRMSRFGPVAQIGTEKELGEDEKPQYANLLKSQSLDTVTAEDALKLFELPKVIGQYKGEDVIIGRGRYGPYVKYGEHYISIRGTDPFSITLNEANEKVKQKLEELKPIGSYEGFDITKGVGRFGPYIRWNNTFVSVPKKKADINSITEKQAVELVKEKIKKDKDRTIQTWNAGDIILIKGRWGPVFRVKGKKKTYPLPKDANGSKISPDTLKNMSEKEIKKLLNI